MNQAVVGQARRKGFFSDLAVPDTIDGRFDMLALHIWLLFDRLSREGAAGARLAESLLALMAKDWDRGFREAGVGDLSVGRQMKRLGAAYFGRARAYDESAADPARLAETLARNVWGGAAVPAGAAERLAAYVSAARASLAAQPFADLALGRVAFPDAEFAR